jgi:hypothetical protein
MARTIIHDAWIVSLIGRRQMRTRVATLAGVLAMVLAIGPVPGVWADDPPDSSFEQTPPRLSLTDGQVSFWRPGAQDWTRAQINTPLAAGDMLATGSPGTLEVQIGARAFVRAWGNTQLSLANLEPDFIQFTLTTGSAVFDLRTLEPGRTVEVDTPNAAITIEQAGYYRVDVTGERSRVMTRRGGRATITPASGQTVGLTPSEEVVIEGTANPQLAAYAAPPLDEWDRWNYARTDRLLDAVSARYVASGTYGVSDLDPYGTWRVVPTYGTVWVPTGVPVGWAPYSTGSWVIDPIYGWTWVDTAPWGWAPYHYGRWCFLDGYWAWAPGPVVVRPVYSPALVVFFDNPSPGVIVGPGLGVGWVALGWGEPVVPWWGRRGHEPSWRGWGGPRVVNNVVINNTTVVNVQNITVYRNASVPHAVVAVDRARFGHGPITATRAFQVDPQRLRPLRAGPEIAATPASFVPTTTRGIRPPDETLKRPVVATRPARRESEVTASGAQPEGRRTMSLPPERLVSVPKPQQQELGGGPPRPSFGHGTIERPMNDRKPSPAPPRPGPTAVGPLGPRQADAPSSPGRQTEPSPIYGKGPSGPPPVTGHPAGPSPTVRQGGPESGKGPAGLASPGPTDGPRPTFRPGPTPPEARNVPGGAPPVIRPPAAPPSTVQPGQISREKGKSPSESPAMNRSPAGPAPAARQVEPQREPGRGSAALNPGARPVPGPPQPPGQGQAPPRLGKGPDGAPAVTGYKGGAPGQAVRRPESIRQPGQALPGEPANRLAPGRGRGDAKSPAEQKD